MREASKNTKCLVKSQIKIGTPSKEPGAGGWYPEGKRRLYEGSGAGDGNPGGKRRPEGSDVEGGIREERGIPKKEGRGRMGIGRKGEAPKKEEKNFKGRG